MKKFSQHCWYRVGFLFFFNRMNIRVPRFTIRNYNWWICIWKNDEILLLLFFIFDTENNCLTSIIIMWKSSRKSLVRVDSFPLFSKWNSRSQYNYLFRFFPATKTLRFMKLFLTNWFKQSKKDFFFYFFDVRMMNSLFKKVVTFLVWLTIQKKTWLRLTSFFLGRSKVAPKNFNKRHFYAIFSQYLLFIT